MQWKPHIFILILMPCTQCTPVRSIHSVSACSLLPSLPTHLRADKKCIITHAGRPNHTPNRDLGPRPSPSSPPMQPCKSVLLHSGEVKPDQERALRDGEGLGMGYGVLIQEILQALLGSLCTLARCGATLGKKKVGRRGVPINPKGMDASHRTNQAVLLS